MMDFFCQHYCNWKLFMHYYNEQLLYASLKVFITINILNNLFDTFYMHHCKSCNWGFLHTIINHKLLVQHCNAQFLYALLILLALICTIILLTFLSIVLNDNFCIYYCIHYNQQMITIFAFKCTMGIETFYALL